MIEQKKAPVKWTTLGTSYVTIADIPIDFPNLTNIDNTIYNTFSRMLGWDGNNWRRLKVSTEGKIEASFTASDIQIGAVEIKDQDSDVRADVVVLGIGLNALVTSCYQAGTWTISMGAFSSTASAPTFATVGIASAQAVPVNAGRKGLILINTSVNQISLAFGANPAVLNSGITLNANGGTFVMDAFTFTTALVNAIASAAGSNLAIQEFT